MTDVNGTLQQLLITHQVSLAELCQHLKIDEQTLANGEPADPSGRLLTTLTEQGRLPELYQYLETHYPHITWRTQADGLSFNAQRDIDLEVHGDMVGGDKITKVTNVDVTQTVTTNTGTIIGVQQGLTVEQVKELYQSLQNDDQPQVWDGRYPYLGLTAFQESDAQFFFGRESLVDELVERVEKANFIVIAGPSGSGKSSVARAGLFHALRSGRLERSDTWLLGSMKPKGNPLEQLAQAIARLAKSPAAGDYIRQNGTTNPLALHNQIETLLSEDTRQRCILLVDQFEETFTQTKDEAARATFIALLTEAAKAENGRTTIILSLRADFVSHCARYPHLRTLMSQQFQLVGAMEPEDLAKAITLPALEVGAEIDPALVSRIMTDMNGEPGALPLMSFALRDLFEAEKSAKGEPMDMTLPEYIERGGIESALERHANQVFDHFTVGQKKLVKNIFSKLIEVGQGRVDTRRTATFAELVPKGVKDETVANIVSSLAQENIRLITTSTAEGEELSTGMNAAATVTIAHEKLIDAWPWLRQLVDDNREDIRIQNEIAEAAKRWEQSNRDYGELYRGAKLQQAIEWYGSNTQQITGLSARFLGASRQAIEQAAREKEAQRQRELDQQRALAKEQQKRAEEAEIAANELRRRRNIAFGLAGGAIILAIVAFFFFDLAQERAVQAEEALKLVSSRQLISQGREVHPENPLLGLILVLEGLTMAESIEQADEVIANSREDIFKWGRSAGFDGQVEKLVLNPSGTFLIVDKLGANGELRSSIDGSLLETLSDEIFDWQMSPNEAFFIIAYEKEVGELRNSSDGTLIEKLPGKIEISRFNYDETLIIIDYENSHELRSSSDGALMATLDGKIEFGSFYETEESIIKLVTYINQPSELRHGIDGSLITKLPGSANYFSSHFSSDETYIFVTYADKAAELWSISDRSIVKEFDPDIVDGRFSPNETFLVVDREDDAPSDLILSSDGTLIEPLSGKVKSLDYSLNETFLLVTYSSDNLPAELRRTADGAIIETLPDDVLNGTFNPSETFFIISRENEPAELRNTNDGSLIETLINDAGYFGEVKFSSNESFFIIDYSDDVAELRDSRDGSRIEPLTGNISDVTLFDSNEDFFIVNYWGKASELRDAKDGSLIEPLHDRISRIDFDLSEEFFIVSYINEDAELRKSNDGTLIETLDYPRVGEWRLSPNETFLFILYVDNLGATTAGELRHSADGSLIKTLGSEVDFWQFSPNETFLFVDYYDGFAELHNIADNSVETFEEPTLDAQFNPAGTFLITTRQDESGHLWYVDGSPIQDLDGIVQGLKFSPSGKFLLIEYENGAGELRNGLDGTLIKTFGKDLNIDILNFEYSPDELYFTVSYGTGEYELLSTKGLNTLASLDENISETIFITTTNKLIVKYANNQSYLLDLPWLEAMNGQVNTLEASKLVQLACTYPLDNGDRLEDPNMEEARQLYLEQVGLEDFQSCKNTTVNE